MGKPDPNPCHMTVSILFHGLDIHGKENKAVIQLYVPVANLWSEISHNNPGLTATNWLQVHQKKTLAGGHAAMKQLDHLSRKWHLLVGNHL